MAKCSRRSAFVCIFISLSLFGLIMTYLSSESKSDNIFFSACTKSPCPDCTDSTHPREIGLIFSSYTKPSMTKVMLKSYRKYGGGFELKVLTNLAKGNPKAKALEADVVEHGADIVYVDGNVYKEDFYPRYMPFMNKRILLQRDWLRRNPLGLKDDDRVFISDEDVLFTNNPFGVFGQYPDRSLFIFSEAYNFTNDHGWNLKYLELTTSIQVLRDYVMKKQVYCMGFVTGKALQLQHLLERMVVAFFIQGFPAQHTRLASDQGVLNVLLHTGLLDDLETERVGDDDPWVAHLTSQLQHADLLKFALSHAVVHQYKYANVVVSYIESTYGINVKKQLG